MDVDTESVPKPLTYKKLFTSIFSSIYLFNLYSKKIELHTFATMKKKKKIKEKMRAKNIQNYRSMCQGPAILYCIYRVSTAVSQRPPRKIT